MRKAQARLRQRIINLVDELHWQTARWLTGNYKVILLPTFETQDMTRRAGRKIRSKTARMMLSFRHYEFKRRLLWKAWQRGVLVVEINEAYTSKICSWDGSVKENLGGGTVIRDASGFGMELTYLCTPKRSDFRNPTVGVTITTPRFADKIRF